ncbi:MAG TPA: CpaD family pilus assembly lipoprotein [Allosphingosinicella sp.]
MARVKPFAALLLLGVSLSACTHDRQYGVAPNRTLYSENQPVVERSDYAFDLASNGGRLGAEERGRLSAWFQSLNLGYGDHVWVDEPYGPTAARSDVARVAADFGILLDAGAPITAGQVEPGRLRVIVRRNTAYVPDCPNHGARGGPSSTSPNFGCAMNSNLAAMIADPSDLVLGEVGTTGDMNTAAKAVQIHRNRVLSGTRGLRGMSTKGN